MSLDLVTFREFPYVPQNFINASVAIFNFVSSKKMADMGSPARARLKTPGMQMLAYQSLSVFKTFIMNFVRSLDKDDRAAFKYWCINIIPQAKLEINVNDDEDIFKLIVFLQNDKKLSITNMSLLKEFLTSIDCANLLEELKCAELSIAIATILEELILSSDSLQHGSDVVCNFFADIVDFLVITKGQNQELISEAFEQLKQAGDDSVILSVLGSVIMECLQGPQNTWSTVTALLVIMGDLYSSITSYSEEHDYSAVKLLAVWMLKHSGLVSIY